MGEKDIAEKNLEAWNDVFADIVNVLLFKGKQVVKEDELEAATPTSAFKAGKKLHQQERDVAKFWKNGEIKISLLGFENQSVADPKMPLRVISYDGASYKQQLLDKKLKKNFPVITLVLYFGEEHWKSAKTLFDCFDVPEELKPFANDYKINVFEIAWLDDETINSFKSDFKYVAQFFKAKRLEKIYEPTDAELKHMDEYFKLLSAVSGDKNFELLYNELKNETDGGVTMCDMFQKYKDAGKEELIIKMIESNILSIEQIAEITKLPVETIKTLSQKVPVLK